MSQTKIRDRFFSEPDSVRVTGGIEARWYHLGAHERLTLEDRVFIGPGLLVLQINQSDGEVVGVTFNPEGTPVQEEG